MGDGNCDPAADFAASIIPILDQIGIDLLMLGDNSGDLPAMVSLIERFESVQKASQECGEEFSYQMSFALQELLTGVLCDRYPDAKSILVFVGKAFESMRSCIDGLISGEATVTCQALIEEAFALLNAPVIALPGGSKIIVREAKASGQAKMQAQSEKDAATLPAVSAAPAATEADEAWASNGVPGSIEDTDLYKEFVFESGEHLATIEEKILKLEESPDDDDLINEIFRAIHSIKGGAGFLGLIGINKLAHDTETLLDRCRKKAIPFSSRVVELCLTSVDHLKQMLGNLGEALDKGTADGLQVVVFGPTRKAIQAYLENPSAEAPAQAAASAKTSAANDGPAPTKLGEILVKEGDISEEQLQNALEMQAAPLGQILIKTGMVQPERLEKALEQQRETTGPGATSAAKAIKVDTEKIDSLVNLVGELVIIEAQITQMVMNGESNNGHREVLEKNVAHFSKITKELQDRSMALRMMPIRQTFQKMLRLVHDSSKKVGKDINLIISGEDTELDKTVVEQIGDPLVHMIRNCVDHGIEPAEERRAAGKPEAGTINLDAYYQGDQIMIRIKDDGKGLNRARIVEKAIENGLLKPGANPTDSEVYGLIFMAGFSTAKEVTEISGRGVGMDVVRRNIEKLRGHIDTHSEAGKGTTFTLSLPLTLAIIDGMVVRVGGEEYIIPTVAIEESLRPLPKDITTVNQRGEMVAVRGSLLPLIRLHDLWGIEPRSRIPSEALTVIVESNGRRACLMVDDLVGQQQIVIKNLGPQFSDVRGFAGATILGSGRVGLIVDVDGVMAQTMS